jgi:hypothetical protein
MNWCFDYVEWLIVVVIGFAELIVWNSVLW